METSIFTTFVENLLNDKDFVKIVTDYDRKQLKIAKAYSYPVGVVVATSKNSNLYNFHISNSSSQLKLIISFNITCGISELINIPGTRFTQKIKLFFINIIIDKQKFEYFIQFPTFQFISPSTFLAFRQYAEKLNIEDTEKFSQDMLALFKIFLYKEIVWSIKND